MDLEFEKPIAELEKEIAVQEKRRRKGDAKASARVASLQQALRTRMNEIYRDLDPWQIVQVARHPERPLIRDYIRAMTTEFIELHGDRAFGDDPALIGGFASIDTRRFMLIGHQKGRTVEENVQFNFGMANPEGYRKALRLMKLAEKFHLPVVCLIDTPGAYPGLDAEARGQAEAIARNLTEMSRLKTPILVIVTGEGGSGGALGIGVGDRVLMLQYAIYSVISPEGCASILWRDGSMAATAARAMKLTAHALLDLGVIDGIIPEPSGGAHHQPEEAIRSVRTAVLEELETLCTRSGSRLTDARYRKYAAMGRMS